MSRTSDSQTRDLAPSGSSPTTDDVDPHVAILSWLDEVRAAMRNAPCAELLNFDGVEGIDVLIAPLYLSALNMMRSGVSEAPYTFIGEKVQRLRQWTYRRRKAWRERRVAAYSASPRPVDVLMWTRLFSHTVQMLPAMAAIRQRGLSCGILACQEYVFDELRAEKVEEPFYTVGAWPQIVRAARKDGERRAKHLAAYGSWPAPPFAHHAAGDLELAIREQFIALLPDLSEAVANSTAAVESFGCRVMVVGNDLTIEGRAAARVAAARGIKTAVFMHGSTSGGRLSAQHCADRLLVFGRNQKRDLLGLGIAEERIVVCGAPSLDNRPRQSGRTHPLLATRLGLEPQEPWILVATSGPGHSVSHQHHEQVLANLTRLSAALPETPMVFKLHRKDRFAYYRAGLKERAGGRYFVVPQGAAGFPPNIFDWLQGCSLVLTGVSSVANEAMLMDVPVITMDFCDELDGTDFIDAGATLHVRTFEALETAVRGLLDAGPSEELKRRVAGYLKDAFLELDGRSGERGAAAICELVEQGNAS